MIRKEPPAASHTRSVAVYVNCTSLLWHRRRLFSFAFSYN